MLLDHGADVSHADEDDGDTALHLWIRPCPIYDVPTPAGNGELDMRTGRLLLGHGARFDTKNALGETPFMLAAREGRSETARLLIEHGADKYAVDISGDTARDYWVNGDLAGHFGTSRQVDCEALDDL